MPTEQEPTREEVLQWLGMAESRATGPSSIQQFLNSVYADSVRRPLTAAQVQGVRNIMMRRLRDGQPTDSVADVANPATTMTGLHIPNGIWMIGRASETDAHFVRIHTIVHSTRTPALVGKRVVSVRTNYQDDRSYRTLGYLMDDGTLRLWRSQSDQTGTPGYLAAQRLLGSLRDREHRGLYSDTGTTSQHDDLGSWTIHTRTLSCFCCNDDLSGTDELRGFDGCRASMRLAAAQRDLFRFSSAGLSSDNPGVSTVQSRAESATNRYNEHRNLVDAANSSISREISTPSPITGWEQ